MATSGEEVAPVSPRGVSGATTPDGAAAGATPPSNRRRKLGPAQMCVLGTQIAAIGLADDAEAEIARLRAERKEAARQRAAAAAALKSEQRKQQRKRQKLSGISTEDILDVLRARSAHAAARSSTEGEPATAEPNAADGNPAHGEANDAEAEPNAAPEGEDADDTQAAGGDDDDDNDDP